MLTRCEHTMRSVCAELDVDLIEFNGEANHMHVLVAYPPTLAISTLVQRLKVRTAYAMRRAYTGISVRTRMRGHFWSRPTSPSPAQAHRCRSSSITPIAKRAHSKPRAIPGE
jgi:REP element-mobilizing transposase RayT